MFFLHYLKMKLLNFHSNLIITNEEIEDTKGSYNNFYIHAINRSLLIDFINLLCKIYNQNIDMSKLSLRSEKYNPHLLESKIDWREMPDLSYNTNICEEHRLTLKIKQDEEEEIIRDIRSKITDTIFKKSNRCIWYKQQRECQEAKGLSFYDDGEQSNPKYPIFIISKGRYENRRTAKYLDKCNIQYYIVVEQAEYDLYIKHGQLKNSILIMPDEWKEQQKDKGYGGSIPVRNYVQHYAKNIIKTLRYWLLDDNIDGYRRLYKGKRINCYSKAVFKVVEDYTERYSNVYLSGHNYQFFCINPFKYPITYNTKIYSSMLIHSDLDDILNTGDLWRGVFNEDVDLSLRILKASLPTIQFNIICSNKSATMSNKGGNTTTIYAMEDAHSKKAESLYIQHPDVVKIVKKFRGKWERIHHYIDWKIYEKNELKMLPNLNLSDCINNYGMILK